MKSLFAWILILASTQSGASDLTDQEAYNLILFPHIRAAGCAECHGVDQAPLFAVDDPVTSFREIKKFLKVKEAKDSLLITQANNGHCGISSVCENSGLIMESYLTTWLVAQGKTASVGTAKQLVLKSRIVVKKELYFGSNILLPITGTKAKIQYRISKHSGYYIVERISVKSSRPTHLRSVKILLNGVPLVRQPLANREWHLRADRSGTMISDDAIVIPTKSNQFELSFEIGEISHPETPKACKNLTLFKAHVEPILKRPVFKYRFTTYYENGGYKIEDKKASNCITCHAGKDPYMSPPKGLPFRKDDSETLCSEVLQYTNSEYPERSIFMKVLQGTNFHPTREYVPDYLEKYKNSYYRALREVNFDRASIIDQYSWEIWARSEN